MWYTLNFDVLFAILLVGMVFSAVFKKSGKLTNNFILFLLTSTAIGLLVYCEVDKRIFDAIGPSLQPMFAGLSKYLNQEAFYGLFYFAILLVIDIVLFLVIKLIISLFTNEKHKFKQDINYTPKHHGIAGFLSGILKFALVLNVILIIVEFANGHFGFDLSNSYVMKYFELWEKPLLDLLESRGLLFFKAVGY